MDIFEEVLGPTRLCRRVDSSRFALSSRRSGAQQERDTRIAWNEPRVTAMKPNCIFEVGVLVLALSAICLFYDSCKGYDCAIPVVIYRSLNSVPALSAEVLPSLPGPPINDLFTLCFHCCFLNCSFPTSPVGHDFGAKHYFFFREIHF